VRILYFDCFSGISGDMTVGALRDIGVPENIFHDAIAALGLGDEIHFHFLKGSKQNIAGTKFDVHSHTHTHHNHDHGHHHDHGHSHGRTYRQIRELLESSTLDPEVLRRALAVFHRIAVAEGKIHGIPPEEVGFHEVGAADSIGDVVAACAGLVSLGVIRCESSPLVEGSGWIDCAHGRFPLPAPATLEILAGIPLRQTEEPTEFITPTGAAILAEFATRFGPMPAMQIKTTGYGLGTRDTPPRPNALRLVLGTAAETASPDSIFQIETNLDDLSPELAGAAMQSLLQHGALDVFFTPAQMKKNRPGFVLTVLCHEDKREELTKILLTETTAFGVRSHRTERITLRREFQNVTTAFGQVQVKLGFLGSQLVQISPEFDSCAQAASNSGATVREVFHAAIAAEALKNRLVSAQK